MASYIDSTPKQFNKYVPTIDQQVYGQLLAKNDTDYKEGVQKVNSYVGAVAGLPVASEEERQYLQGLVNGVTSNINQMVGADYSDQKVVGNIGTQAASIYGDEKVQKAVANAATAKRLVSDMKDDEERTKGQNGANAFVGMQKLNNWRNGHTLGSTLDASYDNYLDAPKTIEDLFAKKHPNQRVRIEPGMTIGPDGKLKLDISKWDEVEHKWRGLRQDEVAGEIGELIDSNPNLSNQLDINSKYKYKDYNAQNFYSDKKSTELAQIQSNDELSKKYLSDLLNVEPHSPEYQAITAKIDQLGVDTERRNQYINNDLYKDAYTFHNNPQARDTYLSELYKQKFIHSHARFFAYGEDDVNFIGDSPTKNFFSSETLKLQNQAMLDKEKETSFNNKLNQLKYENEKALNDAKIAKLHATTPGGTGAGTDGSLPAPEANMGIGTETQYKLGAYQTTRDNLVKMDADLTESRNRFMYNQLGKYGDDLFTFDENNNPIPKAGPKDNPGLYEDQIKEKYSELQKRFQAGDSALAPAVKDHFGELSEKNVQRDLTVKKIARNDDAWSKETANNPEIAKVYNTIDYLNKNPLPVKAGPGLAPYATVTGDDLTKQKQAVKITQDWFAKNQPTLLEKFKYFIKGETTQYDSAEEQVYIDKLRDVYKQVGLSPEKVKAITQETGLGGSLQQLNKSIDGLPITKNKFLDNRMQGSLIYTTQQATGLFSADKNYNEDIRHRAINILTARGGESKVLAEAASKFNLSGTQDPVSKKFFLLVQDPTGKHKVDPVEITDYEASSLGMKDKVTIDPVLTRLALNDDRGLGANTGDPDGTMNFNNSFDALTKQDVDKKSPTFGHNISYRYGVERKPTGWYVTLFKKDLTTGQDAIAIPLPKQNSWPTAKASLNNIIGVHNQQRQSYSYDATIDNNANRNATTDDTE